MNKIPETKVVESLEKNAGKILGSKEEWYLAKEVDSGYGIADLFFYSVNEGMLNERVSNNLKKPILSKEILRTLLALNEFSEPIAISCLTEQLGMKEKFFRGNVLKFLFENGYVIQDEENLALTHEYKISLSCSVAIEAKVSNWKRGLYQAHRYKWYSQQTYLALYHEYIGPAKRNLELFEKLNVGLLSVYDNDIEIVFEPKVENPKSIDTTALVNERLFSPHLQKPVPILV